MSPHRCLVYNQHGEDPKVLAASLKTDKITGQRIIYVSEYVYPVDSDDVFNSAKRIAHMQQTRFHNNILAKYYVNTNLSITGGNSYEVVDSYGDVVDSPCIILDNCLSVAMLHFCCKHCLLIKYEL